MADSKVDQHCIILAAGIAMPAIEPYTQTLPKCFLPIAGKPILHHIIRAFAEQGIENFTIVIGAHAQCFNEDVKADLLSLVESAFGLTPKEDINPSIDFVTNEFFWNNGPADSLKIGYKAWKARAKKSENAEIFVCYGDTVFTDVALGKLVQSPHKNSVIIDRALADANLKTAKSRETGWNELELCSVLKKNIQGFPDQVAVIDQMGKHLLSKNDAFGEFCGLFKIEEKLMSLVCSDAKGGDDLVIVQKDDYNAGMRASPTSSKKNTQVERYVPDLLRKAIQFHNDDFALVAIPIFGNRREIHSVADLLHADTELCYLSDQVGRRAYIRAIGARLLAEANDLKRPLEIVAAELNFPDGILDELLKGNVELDAAQEILRKVNSNYPVSLNALWVEPDDTDAGMRVFRSEQSQASRRVLNRVNRDGFRTPYYEYRDCAMSRLGPFRPEWIEELRTVTDNDPLNPDVAYNNGHLLFQSTFFIGPVNFYYDLGDRADHYASNLLKSKKVSKAGGKFCAEMNTGDSNWIAPFVPHSFTSRDPSQFACIIACTYGAGIVTSLQQLGGLHPDMDKNSGDARDPISQFEANLQRFIGNDCLTKPLLAQILKDKAPKVVSDLLVEGKKPTRLATIEECRILAEELHCLPEDLFVDGKVDFEDVVVKHRGEGPFREQKGTKFERLASSSHHSLIKSFNLEVQPLEKKEEEPAWFQLSMHQFLYNYSGEPCSLQYVDLNQQTKWVVLNPGDSLYLQPQVKQRFWHPKNRAGMLDHLSSSSRPTGRNPKIFIVRIPGDLTKELMFEVSLCDQRGKGRVGKETIRWYN